MGEKRGQVEAAELVPSTEPMACCGSREVEGPGRVVWPHTWLLGMAGAVAGPGKGKPEGNCLCSATSDFGNGWWEEADVAGEEAELAGEARRVGPVVEGGC